MAPKRLSTKADLSSATTLSGPRRLIYEAHHNAHKRPLDQFAYGQFQCQFINGIDVLTAQTVIAEAGADLSAFPSEKQFASWLGLCPTNEQSGGKILNRRTRKVVNRATVAFRNAALTLLRSQSYLGAQYRRLRTRLGAPKAITAMARKLACLFYRLIKHGQQYVDKGTEYYEARYRERQIRSLAKRAQKLGLQLIIPLTA